MKTNRFKIIELEKRTLSWWIRRRDKIDMEPSYQRRGRRWSEHDKSFLIDSILNGFDLPKFYLADFTWGVTPLNEKGFSYSVIDGKQRFEAIFDFYDNKLSLSKNFEYRNDPSKIIAGMKFSQIKESYPDLAEAFDNFNPIVMGVITDSKELIEDLFIRLNRSQPLTGAELRNAMSGNVPGLIRTISEHRFFLENIRFSNKKGADRNSAAKLLLFEITGSPQDTKKRSLDLFVLEYNEDHRKFELDDAGYRVLRKLDALSMVFLPRDPLLGSEGQIPVFYQFIKNLDEEDLSMARDFLGSFFNDESNHSLGFLEYEVANRSVNDRWSHQRRIEILISEFDVWKTSRT